eukprot:13319772-Ditylum_brightwellii.AAC.1
MVHVYPQFTLVKTPTEKAFGFMINKSALEAAEVSAKVRLQTLGNLTGTTPLVLVLQDKCMNHAETFFKTAGQSLTRSYHVTNRKIIPQCHHADRTLKLWDLQMNNSRQPSGITYAKVARNINFSALNVVNKEHPAIPEAHADAIIDFNTTRRQLTDLCLAASWEDIAGKAYKQLCPHFINDPAS